MEYILWSSKHVTSFIRWSIGWLLILREFDLFNTVRSILLPLFASFLHVSDCWASFLWFQHSNITMEYILWSSKHVTSFIRWSIGWLLILKEFDLFNTVRSILFPLFAYILHVSACLASFL